MSSILNALKVIDPTVSGNTIKKWLYNYAKIPQNVSPRDLSISEILFFHGCVINSETETYQLFVDEVERTVTVTTEENESTMNISGFGDVYRKYTDSETSDIIYECLKRNSKHFIVLVGDKDGIVYKDFKKIPNEYLNVMFTIFAQPSEDDIETT